MLAAALNGVLLHRALGPELTSSSVGQVLGRVLARTEAVPNGKPRKTPKGTGRS